MKIYDGGMQARGSKHSAVVVLCCVSTALGGGTKIRQDKSSPLSLQQCLCLLPFVAGSQSTFVSLSLCLIIICKKLAISVPVASRVVHGLG